MAKAKHGTKARLELLDGIEKYLNGGKNWRKGSLHGYGELSETSCLLGALNRCGSEQKWDRVRGELQLLFADLIRGVPNGSVDRPCSTLPAYDCLHARDYNLRDCSVFTLVDFNDNPGTGWSNIRKLLNSAREYLHEHQEV